MLLIGKRKNIRKSLIRFLQQGISPEKLALTVVLGTAIGLIPVLGVSTILCAAVALYLRLNMAAIQLINYFIYPLQLILYVPFIRAGEMLFYGDPVFTSSVGEILDMVKVSWWVTVKQFWVSNLMGVAAWLIAMIPLSFLLYFLLLPLFRRLAPANNHDNNQDQNDRPAFS